ncbi:putative ligase [Helianthus annuus]|nr:putative ligase [Helianthus annuus]
MSIDPEAKMINMDQKRIEKWILRRAFDDEEKPYLPKGPIFFVSHRAQKYFIILGDGPVCLFNGFVYAVQHILYRQKEQFSDGVGYSWIDGLKSHAEQHVTNKMMLNAERIFPHHTPVTKEAYYYRIYSSGFSLRQNSAKLTVPGGASVACSTAKAIEWDASWSNNLDPSGRAALGVHNAAYKKNPGSISSANLEPSIVENVPRMMDITVLSS